VVASRLIPCKVTIWIFGSGGGTLCDAGHDFCRGTGFFLAQPPMGGVDGPLYLYVGGVSPERFGAATLATPVLSETGGVTLTRGTRLASAPAPPGGTTKGTVAETTVEWRRESGSCEATVFLELSNGG
jgi:hypothetical protein